MHRRSGALGSYGQGIVIENADTGTVGSPCHQDPLSRLFGRSAGFTTTTGMMRSMAFQEIPAEPIPQRLAMIRDMAPIPRGTVVGDDGMGNQIGVALWRTGSAAATWIAVSERPRVTSSVFGFSSHQPMEKDYIPTPDLRPHVLNNSWSCPTSEVAR